MLIEIFKLLRLFVLSFMLLAVVTTGAQETQSGFERGVAAYGRGIDWGCVSYFA